MCLRAPRSSFSTPLLSSKEKAASMVFLAYGNFEFWEEYPKTPKTTCFWVRLMDFWAEREPRLVNPLFYTREKFPRSWGCSAHFFYVQDAPYMYYLYIYIYIYRHRRGCRRRR